MTPAGDQISMRKFTIIAAVLAAILLVLVSVLIVLEIRNSNELPDNTDNTGSADHMDTTEFSTTPRPWEQSGAKQPEDYTWDEFLKLSAELQHAFQYAFDSAETFDAWLKRVQPAEPDQPEQPVYPWDQTGAKQPKDYTWDEFLTLSSELQIAFQYTFGSSEAFDAWLSRVQPTEPDAGYPWEQPGAKQPENYTWEEFTALSAELQHAFQYACGSAEAFDAWLNRVQPTEPEQIDCPWEQPGAKQPKDYTWDEFLALSTGQQHAFQYAFGSTEAFDAWLNRVMPKP